MRRFIEYIDDTGRCLIFTGKVIATMIKHPCGFRPILEQTWHVFILSLSTTALAGFMTGAIMCMQFVIQAKGFGALSYLGGLTTSGTVREVGPLLIAFMLAGRVGAFTAAELGAMKVTDQIDSIRALALDPVEIIVVPRFLGIIFSSFFLLLAGLCMAVAGGLVMSIFYGGINLQEFVHHIPTIVSFSSVAGGVFKCSVFAILIASVCTYRGYTTADGAGSVGRSVVDTAVMSMLWIVVFDWLTSLITRSLCDLAGVVS